MGTYDRKVRIVALLMGVFMVLALLIATYYTAQESGHTCEGEDCPVCACLKMCKEVVHKLGFAILPVIVSVLTFGGTFAGVCLLCFECVLETPVTMKVRMNN